MLKKTHPCISTFLLTFYFSSLFWHELEDHVHFCPVSPSSACVDNNQGFIEECLYIYIYPVFDHLEKLHD